MTRNSFLKLVVSPLVECGLLLTCLLHYGWRATLVLLVWWTAANAVRAAWQAP